MEAALMYVLKIDFPAGVAYFTGKKRIVQGTESPGLTEMLGQARLFESEEEAQKYCKMLVRKYDMDFYYTDLDAVPASTEDAEEQEFMLDLSAEIASELDGTEKPDDTRNDADGQQTAPEAEAAGGEVIRPDISIWKPSEKDELDLAEIKAADEDEQNPEQDQ